jgi:hypothetical protein
MHTLMITMGIVAGTWAGAFTLDDNGATVTVKEGDKPVMVYHYTMVEPPKDVKANFKRSCYVHPLYGLDGEVMTEDFPADHPHHRGVFWAWPMSTYGDRKMDVWTLDDSRQVFGKWIAKEAGADKAVLEMENNWLFDDAPDKPIIRETVRMEILPATDKARPIDISIRLENISDKVFTMRGSDVSNKGYGGMCIRPDSDRKPMLFTAASGAIDKDMLELATPWADVSYATKKGGDALSGVALFEHPSNPGYPHPGWILRKYSFLGQSWPHTANHEMKPGDKVELRYRMLVHRDGADKAGVAAAFDQYTKEATGK